jgi:hypothetical protein
MVITTTNLEKGHSVSFIDAEGWDIVVDSGYAIFEWNGTDDFAKEELNFVPHPDGAPFKTNEIFNCAAVVAPSNFLVFYVLLKPEPDNTTITPH